MSTLSLAGREIVFIQGYSGDEDAGKPQEAYPNLRAALLAAGAVAVHSIAPDYRGRTFDAWTEDVAAQIDARNVSTGARLLGHSFGAILATAEAARRPYDRLILCSLTPTGAYVSRDPVITPRIVEACGSQETYDILLGTDMGPLLERAKVPAENRHVLLESANEFMGELASQAEAAARILGTTVTHVPESRHYMEAYPTYIEAAVRAAS